MKGHLIQSLSWLTIIVASAFILWGQADVIHIVKLLLVFVLLRGLKLFSQWNQQALSEEGKEVLAVELAREMVDEQSHSHARDEGEHDFGRKMDTVLSSPEYTQRLNAIYARHVPRAHSAIASEAACLLAVMPAAFLMGLMLTQNLVTFSGSTRWNMGVALTAAVATYFVLNIITARYSSIGIRLRWAVTIAALAITGITVFTKHPYLLHSGVERRKQMAERVWNLGLSIEASRHAKVLFAYARDLAETQRIESAAEVYERGLLMEPHDRDERLYLIELYEKLGREQEATRHRNMIKGRDLSADRLFAQFSNVRPLPKIEPKWYGNFVLCLVAVEDVPGALLDRVGAEVAARLGVAVVCYPRKITLPEADRLNGLRGGRQWHAMSLFNAFSAQGAPFPSGACQFILVTSNDIYTDASNFVFGGGGGGHGFVSYYRFHNTNEAPEKDILLIDRLAKQICSSSIKSFGISSTDPNCVTVYCHDLREFDLKAQLPAPATAQRYREEIRKLEAQQTAVRL